MRISTESKLSNIKLVKSNYYASHKKESGIYEENCKMIVQTKGRKSHNLIFDKETYEQAIKYVWRCKHRREIRWFYTLINGRERSLKSVLFQPDIKSRTVFRNGNDADFGKENMEILTNQEYAHKYIASFMKKKSIYNNVTWDSKSCKWKVRFFKDRKVVYERYLTDEYEAAIVADYKALELYEDNKLNLEFLSREELTHLYNNLMGKYGEDRKTIKSISNQGDNRGVGASKYVGVTLDKRDGRWCAKIKKNGKSYWCGRFVEEKDAAIVHIILKR